MITQVVKCSQLCMYTYLWVIIVKLQEYIFVGGRELHSFYKIMSVLQVSIAAHHLF